MEPETHVAEYLRIAKAWRATAPGEHQAPSWWSQRSTAVDALIEILGEPEALALASCLSIALSTGSPT